MAEKSTHLQVVLQQSTQNGHAKETSGLFYYMTRAPDFSSRNNFAILGYFAKVSAPVGSIIPWL